ncbi:hypothetical protein FNF29_02311 [Cafeteria roenbergensis]|uniref:Uncharacterized protein n=1 Tax=Cafeteria roenbergensis TaxID=33653 RepID=A0A5A8CNX0_CAFRO|nr:hypothetical protein FNF29_02311 [Cafeteria roenbergensis]|eukprot:KAA0154782.1 hypothetical protein FNF29_02311 [Cafeteria roenbergensis]
MAARRPSKLGLHNQDPPPRHALVTEVRGGVTYYIGANGSCFRMLRTLSKCLAGHMLLAECVRREVRPDGSIAFAPTGEHRALKRLSKYHLEHGISLDGRRISEDPVLEIGAMHYLSKRPPHGNVMFMHAVYEDASFLFLELECLGGGDLFEAVQGSPGGKFPEARARRVLRQVLQGLCFMHGHGIIHRDLSLENVMLASRDPGAEVKIIDMGLCVDRWRFAPGLIPPQGCVGKASYMAPETYLDSEFDESVDLWCVAVMLFMMLFGVPPYRKPHAGLCALFREIEAGRLLDLVAKWGMGGSVSPDAQDLLRRMLSVSRADRPTLPEVLAHPWMAPEMADLGGAARAAEQASLVLDVAGWAKHETAEGKVYYENFSTGLTQWQFPGVGEAPQPTQLPPGWAKCTTEDGRTYYEHPERAITQWEFPQEEDATAAGQRPLPEGWVRLMTGDGRPYYENEALALTQWAFPGEAPGEPAAQPVAQQASITTQAAVEGSSAVPEDITATSAEGVASTKASAATSAASSVAGAEWAPLPAVSPVPHPGVDDTSGGWESREEFEDQLAYFDDIDESRNGFVTAQDMRVYSEKNGLELSEEDISDAVASQDLDGDGHITIREFFIALDRPVPLRSKWMPDVLYHRFAAFPDAGLSPIELRKLLDSVEMQYSVADVRHWMKHPLGSRDKDGMRRIPLEAVRHIFFPDMFEARPAAEQ